MARWSWLNFPADMPAPWRGVLRAIVAGPRAWSQRGPIDEAYPGAVDALIVAGWVKPWDFPRYEPAALSVEEARRKGLSVTDDPGPNTEPMITLTEWGAERLGAAIKEEWSHRSVTRREWDGPHRPRRKIRRRAAENIARWARSDVPPMEERSTAAVIQPTPEKPLAPHVIEVGLAIPLVKIVHKQADNPVLIDPDTGRAVRLFAGGEEGAGLVVAIDKRLTRKR